MDFSIIIPAYNEERRIGPTVEQIFAYLEDRRIDAEILVIDDGCTDNTGEVAREAAAGRNLQVLDYGGNRGKGYAVRYGLSHGKGDRLLFSDADLSTPIEELAKLSKALDEGNDIAIGSRAIAGANVVVSQSGLRKYGGKIFNLMVRSIVPIPFKDTQCGFKMFDRVACAPLFEMLKLEGFSFDVEMMVLATKLGLQVTELPVEWHNSPETKVNFARDSLRMLRDVCKIRWWTLTGAYPYGKLDRPEPRQLS